MQGSSIQQQLFAAIESGDLPLVRDLLAAGADVNRRSSDPDGHTPLLRAVTTIGKPAIVSELIKAGADVKARTPVREVFSPTQRVNIRCGGETALHLAAAVNNAEAIKVLIQAGAEI